MFVTTFLLVCLGLFLVERLASATFTFLSVLLFGTKNQLHAYASIRLVSCGFLFTTNVTVALARAILTIGTYTIKYTLLTGMLCSVSAAVYILYTYSPNTILNATNKWNENVAPVVQTTILSPLQLLSDITLTVIPLFNFIVWITQKVLYQTFILLSIDAIDAFVIMAKGFATFLESSTMSTVNYINVIFTCATAEATPLSRDSSFCVYPNTRTFDIYTPVTEAKNIALGAVLLLKSMCRVASMPLDVIIYPILDTNTARGLHYIFNAFLDVFIHVPMQTVLRCSRFKEPSGPGSILPCLPDFENTFDLLTAGINALGTMMDNWLNVILVIVEEWTFGTSPICVPLAAQLKGLWSMTHESIFGKNHTAIVSLNDGIIAETDGVHISYTHIYRTSTTTEHSLNAWQSPIDVSLGLAAITYLPNTDMDNKGSSSTAMLGCVCKDDNDAGLRLECGIARYTADSGNTYVELPVSFSLPTSGKYLRCRETKIRIESVRWPISRVVTNDVAMDRTISKFNLNPSCLQAGSSCISIDATVWIQPACGILNGRDEATQKACLASFTKSNCYPFCLGVHLRGNANSPLIFYGAKQWSSSVYLPKRDCTRTHMTVSSDGSLSSDFQNGQTTTLIGNDPTGSVQFTRNDWNAEEGCVYNPSATSMISGHTATTNAEMADPDTMFFVYPEQPFVVTADVTLTAIRSGPDNEVQSVSVQRLYQDEQGGITLIQTNVAIPAGRSCVVQRCDPPPNGKLEVPFDVYRIPSMHTPATSTPDYVFFSTTPDLETLMPLATKCRSEINPKLDIIVWSNIAPLRVWRVPAYTSAARCGPDCRKSSFVDIWKLNDENPDQQMAVSLECDKRLGVRVLGLEYINTENILITVQRTTLQNLDVSAPRGVKNVSSTDIEMYFLHPIRMALQKDRLWDREYEVLHPNASSQFALGIETWSHADDAVGRLCPAMVRMPSFGTMAARALSAALNLIRVYPIRLLTWSPVFTSKELWRSIQRCKDPSASRNGYSHPLYRFCGSQIFSIDLFFEDVYVANTLAWQSFAVVGSALTNIGGDAAPAVTFLNGVAVYGAQTKLATQIASAESMKAAFSSDTIPVESLSTRIFGAVTQMPISTYAVFTLTMHPVAVAEFTYEFTVTLVADIINAVYGVQGSRAPELILWDSVYRMRTLYESIIITKQFRACDGLALTVGYTGPLGQMVRASCDASIHVVQGAMQLLSALVVDVPNVVCMCIDSRGHDLRLYIQNTCFNKAPLEYRPLLQEIYMSNGFQDQAMCTSLLDLTTLHIQTSFHPLVEDLYAVSGSIAAMVNILGGMIDPSLSVCGDAYTDPHVDLLVPEPIDYFRVCGTTSNCKQRCAPLWDEFQFALSASSSSETSMTVVQSYQFPNDIFRLDGTDPDIPGSIILSITQVQQKFDICGRETDLRYDIGICALALRHSFEKDGKTIAAPNNVLHISCYCIPGAKNAGIRASANKQSTDWTAVSNIDSSGFYVQDAQFIGDHNTIAVLGANNAGIHIYNIRYGSDNVVRIIPMELIREKLQQVLNTEVEQDAISSMACGIGDLFYGCLLQMRYIAKTVDFAKQGTRHAHAWLQLHGTASSGFYNAEIKTLYIDGYDIFLGYSKGAKEQITDYVYVQDNAQEKTLLTIPRDFSETNPRKMAKCRIGGTNAQIIVLECEAIASSAHSLLRDFSMSSALSTSAVRDTQSVYRQGRFLQNTITDSNFNFAEDTLILMISSHLRQWLRMISIKGLTANNPQSTSTMHRLIPTNVVYTTKCGPSSCSACSARAGLQRVCYDLEDCLLRKCIGTLVNHANVLCAISGVAQSYMDMILQQALIAWVVISETLTTILLHTADTTKTSMEIRWPEDAFFNVVCEAKDVTAHTATLVTSTIYNAIHLAKDKTRGLLGSSKNIDTVENARLTLTMASTTAFLNQILLAPLYLFLSMQRMLLCQTNAILAALNPTSFEIQIGMKETSTASNNVLGKCLTASADAELSSTSTGDSLSVAILSAITDVAGAIRSMPLSYVKHPIDAFFTWLIGIFTGIQDMISTSDQANCRVPDFSKASAMRCACSDHAVKINNDRRSEGLSESAFWCTGALHLVDDYGNARVVFNPYTFQELYTALKSLEQPSKLQQYLDCISTFQDLSSCKSRLVTPGPLSSQSVSAMSVFMKCRSNYAARRWDSAAHILFSGIDPGTAASKAAYEMMKLNGNLNENTDGSCLKAVSADGGQASEICLERMLTRRKTTRLTYFRYDAILNQRNDMDSIDIDACESFTGPTAQAFKKCTQDDTVLPEEPTCTLPALIWTPASQNRVPVANAHAVIKVQETAKVRGRIVSIADKVLQMLNSERFTDWSSKDSIDFSLFSTEGDSLHQMFDCFFLGPFGSTKLWPNADGRLNVPIYSRGTDHTNTRDFQLPCAMGTGEGDQLLGDYRSPFTCGSNARRSIIKYFVRDKFSKKSGDGSTDKVSEMVQAMIAKFRDAWQTGKDDADQFGCECTDKQSPSIECCKTSGNTEETFVPFSLRKLTITNIDSSIVAEKVLSQAQTFLEHDILVDSIKSVVFKYMAPETHTVYDWQTKQSNKETASDHGLYHYDKPTVTYDSTEVQDPLGISRDNTSSILDMCMDAIGAVMYTLPLQFDAISKEWMPHDMDSNESPPDPLDDDPSHFMQNNAHRIEQFVRRITRKALQKSPLYWSHDTRYVPSKSEFCRHRRYYNTVDKKPTLGHYTLKQNEFLHGLSMEDDVGIDVSIPNTPVMRFPAEHFSFANLNNTCPCGWATEDQNGVTICSIPPPVCDHFSSLAPELTTPDIQHVRDVCSIPSGISNPESIDHLAFERALHPHWNESWHCPHYERMHGGWGHFSNASENPDDTTSIVEDILAGGKAGIRLGNFKRLLFEEIRSSNLTLNRRKHKLSDGQHSRYQDMCEEDYRALFERERNLAELFVDRLFPAAQSVSFDSPAATCTRYVIEVARHYAFEDLRIDGEDSYEQMKTWEQRCNAQLEFVNVCKLFNVNQGIGYLDRTERTKHATTACKAELVGGTESEWYVTRACLIVTSDLRVFDPCACKKCTGTTAINIDDVLEDPKCRRESLHGSKLTSNLAIGSWPTYKSASMPLKELQDEIFEMLQNHDGSSIRLSVDAENILTNSEDSHTGRFSGAINTPLNNNADTWMDVEGVAENSGTTCNGIVDWWPRAWISFPTGYHPTTSCHSSSTRYRGFQNGYSVDKTSHVPKIYYEKDRLRWPHLSRNHIGASGRCNIFTFGMPMVITNSMRVCTKQSLARPEAVETFNDTYAGYPETCEEPCTKSACTQSPYEVPWNIVDDPLSVSEWMTGSVGAVLVNWDYFMVKQEQFPPSGQVIQTLLRTFDTVWGDSDFNCGLLKLQMFPDQLESTLINSFCRVRNGRCIKDHTCDMHRDCQQGYMCNGFGECVMPHVQFHNFNRIRDIEIQWHSEAKLLNNSSFGEIIEFINNDDSSPWEYVPEFLKYSGFCSFRNWFELSKLCKSPMGDKCEVDTTTGSINTQTASDDQTPRLYDAGIMRVQPTTCDMHYHHYSELDITQPKVVQTHETGSHDFNATESVVPQYSRIFQTYKWTSNTTGKLALSYSRERFQSFETSMFYNSSKTPAPKIQPCRSARGCEAWSHTWEFERSLRRTPSHTEYSALDRMLCGPFAYLKDKDMTDPPCFLDKHILPIVERLCDNDARKSIEVACGKKLEIPNFMCDWDTPLYDLTMRDPTTQKHITKRKTIATQINNVYNLFSNLYSDEEDVVMRHILILQCASKIYKKMNQNPPPLHVGNGGIDKDHQTIYLFGSFSEFEFPFSWLFRCTMLQNIQIPPDILWSGATLTDTIRCDSWDNHNIEAGSPIENIQRSVYAFGGDNIDKTAPLGQRILGMAETYTMQNILDDVLKSAFEYFSSKFNLNFTTVDDIFKRVCIEDAFINPIYINTQKTYIKNVERGNIQSLLNGIKPLCSAFNSNEDIEPCLLHSFSKGKIKSSYTSDPNMNFKSILQILILRDMEAVSVTTDTGRTLPEFTWKRVNLNLPEYLPVSEYTSDDLYIPSFACTENIDETTILDIAPTHAEYNDLQHSNYTETSNSSHFCLSKYINDDSDRIKTRRNYIAFTTDPYENIQTILESSTEEIVRTSTTYAVDVCSEHLNSPTRDNAIGTLPSLVAINKQTCTEKYKLSCKSAWPPDGGAYSYEATNEACIATSGSGFNLPDQKAAWTTPGINTTLYRLSRDDGTYDALTEELNAPLNSQEERYPAAYACPESRTTTMKNFGTFVPDQSTAFRTVTTPIVAKYRRSYYSTRTVNTHFTDDRYHDENYARNMCGNTLHTTQTWKPGMPTLSISVFYNREDNIVNHKCRPEQYRPDHIKQLCDACYGWSNYYYRCCKFELRDITLVTENEYDEFQITEQKLVMRTPNFITWYNTMEWDEPGINAIYMPAENLRYNIFSRTGEAIPHITMSSEYLIAQTTIRMDLHQRLFSFFMRPLQDFSCESKTEMVPCPSTHFWKRIYGKMMKCEKCDKFQKYRACNGPAACGYLHPHSLITGAKKPWSLLETKRTELLKTYYTIFKTEFISLYKEAGFSEDVPPHISAPVTIPFFEDISQDGSQDLKSLDDMISLFPTFQVKHIQDYETSTMSSVDECVDSAKKETLENALDYHKCSSDKERQDLLQFVTSTYVHKAHPIIPRLSSMRWKMPRELLLSKNSLSWAHASRSTESRLVSWALDGPTQCSHGIGSTSYCIPVKAPTSAQKDSHIHINPWYGGNFDPGSNCDVKDSGIETLIVDSACPLEENCVEFTQSGCMYRDGTEIQVQSYNAFVDRSNICRVKYPYISRTCNHTQGQLGNAKGQTITTLRNTVPYPTAEAATLSRNQPHRKRALLLGDDTESGTIQLHDNEIGGHELVFAINSMNQMRLVKMPLGALENAPTQRVKEGERQPGVVYGKHHDDDVEWLENYMGEGGNREDKRNRDIYRTIRYNDTHSHWSCPLRRFAFYQEHAMIPEPRRAYQIYGAVNNYSYLHPMQESMPIGDRIGKYTTHNGYCFCPITSRCFTNAGSKTEGKCSLLGTLRSLHSDNFTSVLVLAPDRTDHDKSYYMDWPNGHHSLRDGSLRNKTSERPYFIHDRVQPYYLKYTDSRQILHYHKTTLDLGGDCAMGDLIDEAELTRMQKNRCRFSHFANNSFFFACTGQASYVETKVQQQHTPQDLANTLHYCDECSPPPEFHTRHNPDEPSTKDTVERMSYGRLTRFSASQRLASAFRHAICGDKNDCPEMQNAKWNHSFFREAFFKSPGHLLNKSNTTSRFNDMLQKKKRLQNAIENAENSLWESIPWIHCDPSNPTTCSGTMPRATWLSKERAQQCKAAIVNGEATGNISTTSQVSFCDLHKDLNDLCLFIDTAANKIQNILCEFGEQCDSGKFFYQPAVYSVPNHEYVRVTVRKVYETIAPGSCVSAVDDDARSKIQNTNYLSNCAAKDFETVKEYLKNIRSIITKIIQVIYTMFMFSMSLLQYVFSITSSEGFAEQQLDYWWHEFIAIALDLLKEVAEMLYEIIFDIGTGFGAKMKEVIIAICKFINDYILPYVWPVICFVLKVVRIIVTELLKAAKALNVFGKLDGIIDKLTEFSEDLFDMFPCDDDPSLKCVDLFPPDNGDAPANKLPVPTRCWVGYEPPLGSLIQSGIPTCTPSSTCRKSRLGGEIDDGEDNLVMCDACPANADPYIQSFGCDWLMHTCVCGVAPIHRTPCTSNAQCSRSSLTYGLTDNNCMLVSSDLEDSYGTIQCKDCANEQICMVKSATDTHGYCACPASPVTIAECNAPGTRITLLERASCLVPAHADTVSQLSTDITYTAKWDHLAVTPCIYLDLSKMFCYDTQLYDGRRAFLSVGLQLLSINSEYDSLYGIPTTRSRRLLQYDENGVALDPFDGNWTSAAGECAEALSTGRVESLLAKQCVYWRTVGRTMIDHFNMTHFTNDGIWTSYQYTLWVITTDTPAFMRDVAKLEVLSYVASHTHAFHAAFNVMEYMRRSLMRSVVFHAITRELNALDHNHRLNMSKTLGIVNASTLEHGPSIESESALELATDIIKHAIFPHTMLDTWETMVPDLTQEHFQELFYEVTKSPQTPNTTNRTLRALQSIASDYKDLTRWPPRYTYTTQNRTHTCAYGSTVLEQLITNTKLLLTYYITGGSKNTTRGNRKISKGFSANLPETINISNATVQNASSNEEWFLQRLWGINRKQIRELFNVSQLSAVAEELFICRYEDLILCPSRRKDLFWGAIVSTGSIVMMGTVFGGVTRSLIINALFTSSTAYSLTLWYVYGLSPFCFPLIPTCFVSDLTYVIKSSVPSYVAPPQALIRPDCVEDGTGRCFLSCSEEPMLMNSTMSVVAWWYCDIFRQHECIQDSHSIRSYANSSWYIRPLDELAMALHAHGTTQRQSYLAQEQCVLPDTYPQQVTDITQPTCISNSKDATPDWSARDIHISRRFCATISTFYIWPLLVAILLIPSMISVTVDLLCSVLISLMQLVAECISYSFSV